MRTTVERTPEGGRREIHTPNVAGFHGVGSGYTRRAMDARGDESDWVALSPMLLFEMLRDDLGIDHGSGLGLFAGSFSPVSGPAYVMQLQLFESLRCGEPLSDIGVEESALALVRRVLRDAYVFWSTTSRAKRTPRLPCERKRGELVEHVKRLLALGYQSTLSLSELASVVHCSPGQLTRVFRAQTGFSIHRYQQHLRLRSALPLVLESKSGLADLAAQLGFSSHSHFSAAFRAEFGMTPTALAQARGRAQRALSKS
jgi:AraC-like DNA-binding protein